MLLIQGNGLIQSYSRILQVSESVVVVVVFTTHDLPRQFFLPFECSLHTDEFLPMRVEGISHSLRKGQQVDQLAKTR